MKKLLKIIYKSIPGKKYLFLFLKAIINLPHSVYKHLHFVGVIDVRVNKGSNFKIKHYGFEIENEIFWNGLENGWEKHSIDLWKKMCADADVIFDIGANTGVFALIAKSIGQQKKVYAFEPVERVYKKLVQNIQLNKFSIVSKEVALSNYNGKAIIHDLPTEHIYSVTVNKNNFHDPSLKTNEVEIDVQKLSTFIKDNKISNIDLMKIDVETHEVEVLEGMGEYLNKFQPSMLIEILTAEVAEGVNKILKDMNYLYFNIDEEKGLQQVDQLEISSTFNFLVCSPSMASKLGLNIAKTDLS